MKNRPKIFFEPDYMIRDGPVCWAGLFCQVATLARLSCNYTKLMFLAQAQRSRFQSGKPSRPVPISALSVLKTATTVYKGKIRSFGSFDRYW